MKTKVIKVRIELEEEFLFDYMDAFRVSYTRAIRNIKEQVEFYGLDKIKEDLKFREQILEAKKRPQSEN